MIFVILEYSNVIYYMQKTYIYTQTPDRHAIAKEKRFCFCYDWVTRQHNVYLYFIVYVVFIYYYYLLSRRTTNNIIWMYYTLPKLHIVDCFGGKSLLRIWFALRMQYAVGIKCIIISCALGRHLRGNFIISRIELFGEIYW